MTSRKSLGFQDSQPAPAGAAAFRTLPAGIWALGLGSLFMDISSELIHSLLPIFMSVVLGTSMATIGLVEGAAEATAAVTKVFSGAISDRLGKRKFLMVFGYALGAFTKPVFPLASVIAGALWAAFGAPATFLAGGVFAALTAFGLLVYRERPRPQ